MVASGLVGRRRVFQFDFLGKRDFMGLLFVVGRPLINYVFLDDLLTAALKKTDVQCHRARLAGMLVTCTSLCLLNFYGDLSRQTLILTRLLSCLLTNIASQDFCVALLRTTVSKARRLLHKNEVRGGKAGILDIWRKWLRSRARAF